MSAEQAVYSGTTRSRGRSGSPYKPLAAYVLGVGAVVVAVTDVLKYFSFAHGDLVNAFIVATFVLLLGAVLVLQAWIVSLLSAIGAIRQELHDGNPAKASARAVVGLAACILTLPCAPAFWIVALVSILDWLNRIAS